MVIEKAKDRDAVLSDLRVEQVESSPTRTGRRRFSGPGLWPASTVRSTLVTAVVLVGVVGRRRGNSRQRQSARTRVRRVSRLDDHGHSPLTRL